MLNRITEGINRGNMSFRVSLLTFLLFAVFGGMRPNLATTDGRSATVPSAGSAIIAYWQKMLPDSTMPSAIRDLLTPNNADANKDNPYPIPASAFYGKEANSLNPTIFYGKATNGDDNPYPIPATAFYEKEANNRNPTIFGKGTNGDDNPYPIPATAFYGKEANNLNPTIFYRKEINRDDNPYVPVLAFHGKEVNNLNPVNNLPLSAFYGKEVNNLPVSAFSGKATIGPVHVSKMNIADDADHHVHEHRHIDGGHDHFDSRNIGFLFLEDALTPGSKVAPYIDPASSRGAPLLPRDVADSIPMSTKSFTDILRMFSPVSHTMTCHGIPFPYKVFLCHALVPTKVYSVTVERDDDDGVEEKERMEEALVVCHLNTAEFDPMKMPPRVKPGDAPVCHFLNNDDVLWAPAATTLGTQQGAAEDVVVAAQ
ncbi:hypothetical protein BDA96_09G207900 [Sorghum bicolor]|uniref:BURP domain-containing protein n=1 Tax=Sorghum bicolor TaxID=4558 RepID=A0A921QDL1_SORBI|nr:hypothetical protein BDA96_09G207900 [Sorghum bicolor]